MYTQTAIETQERLTDSGDSGWSLQKHKLSPLSSDSSRVKLVIPDAKYSICAFARDIVTALDDYYSLFVTTIYLTEWTLGTSLFDQVGWKACELIRRGYGELRSLEVAPVHVLRYDYSVEAQALLIQIFIHQWSAIVIPGPIMFFIYIDEETLWFHVHDAKVAKYVSDKLARWNPQII